MSQLSTDQPLKAEEKQDRRTRVGTGTDFKGFTARMGSRLIAHAEKYERDSSQASTQDGSQGTIEIVAREVGGQIGFIGSEISDSDPSRPSISVSCRCEGTAVSKPLKNSTDMCRRLLLEKKKKKKKEKKSGSRSRRIDRRS